MIQDTPKLTATARDPQLPTKSEATEAAKNFEAIFVQMIVKEMRESSKSFGEGMFGEGVGSDIHEGWFDTMLSDRLASSGRIGFADNIVRDWDSKGRLSPDSAEPAAQRGGIQALRKYPEIKTLAVDPKFTTLEPDTSESEEANAENGYGIRSLKHGINDVYRARR